MQLQKRFLVISDSALKLQMGKLGILTRTQNNLDFSDYCL